MYRPSIDLKTIAPAELPPLITAIENVMHDVQLIMLSAADEHLRAFIQQMRDKFGVDEILINEPYLPKTIAYSSLKFLIQLQRLVEKIERGAEDEDFHTDIFDFDEPLMPQLDTRLQLETVRHQLAAKQELDKTRQQSFGVKKFIWRADGNSCPICAPLDGQIFEWGKGEEPGSIHPNCQCSAEPVLDGSEIDDPPIEPVYPIETLLAILVGAGTAWKVAREIVRSTEEPAPTNPKPEQTPKPQTSKPLLRRDYEKEVKDLEKLEQKMRSEGKTNEEIARRLSKQRREIGEKYKELTPKEIRDKIYQRNEKRYGDKLGPSISELRRRGKSWEEIIKSSKRPGGEDLF